MERTRKAGKGTHGKRVPPAASRRPAGDPPLREAAVTLDAEDIALARLQAHLRRTETIHAAEPPAPAATRRTTFRLPAVLVARVRERAKRDNVTASEVVEQALRRFLRTR